MLQSRFMECVMMIKKAEMCAGTLTLNSKKQVLLIKPSNRNAWAVPKGHVERDESITETACRETFEETSVSVTVVSALPDFIVETESSLKIVKMFLARADSDADPRPDGVENADARYFDITDLPKIIQSQRSWFTNVVSQLLAL
jgi:ADP-ribose pyrophosphatase YjhB (NUDIX family)